MIAITIIPGATTIMPSVTLPPLSAPTTPPPAATSTSRNVPQVSAKTRRHSREESKKSSVGLPLDHTLLLRRVRPALLSRFHSHLLFNLAPVLVFPDHNLDRNRSTLRVLDDFHRHVA